MKKKSVFYFLMLLFCASFGYGQTLIISDSGQTGTSGTNWSITNSVLTVSGNADVNPSVIQDALNAGDLLVIAGTIDINNNITKNSGSDATLTLKAEDKIYSNGTSISSSSNKLNVLFWVESDGEKSVGAYVGSIDTNGGHIWVGGGDGSMIWNGLTVGDGFSMSDGTANHNGMDLHGNLTTNGGDVYLAADDGTNSNPSIGAINNISINTGSGDISFIVRDPSSFSYLGNTITLNTSGVLTIAPPSNEDWKNHFIWDGTGTTNLTGSESLDGLIVNNQASLGGLVIGQYLGTGIDGDTVYSSSNAQNITFSEDVSIAGPISVYGGTIAINATLNTTGGGAAGDILLKGSGSLTIANNKSITTNGGDIVFWANAADGNASGQILMGDGVTLNSINGSTAPGLSGGGDIILAGGSSVDSDGHPNGYAQSSSKYGISLNANPSDDKLFSAYSGGGRHSDLR